MKSLLMRISICILLLHIIVQVQVRIQFKKEVGLREALSTVGSYSLANNSSYYSSFYPEIYAAVPLIQAVIVVPLLRQNSSIQVVDTSFISVPIRYLLHEITNQFCDVHNSPSGMLPAPCDHRLFINPQEFARWQ